MKHNVDEIYDLLPFILHPNNIASYDDGVILIGNRSRYPHERSSVRCESVEEVAIAIEQMVTQGAGSWQAAACGLALAGREADRLPAAEQLDHMQQARLRLVATRPTNTAMARRLSAALDAVAARPSGLSCEQAVVDWLAATRATIYRDYAARARFAADLIDDGDGILTMCFAEAAFVLAIALAKQDGKTIEIFVPETRPWLQGARLTAPAIVEIGVKPPRQHKIGDVVIIGDNRLLKCPDFVDDIAI